MTNQKKRIIFIVGPTGVGKSEVAVRLAVKLNAEIICCDSMQVYKGLGLITSQPSKIQRKKAVHHLFDIIAPEKEYNVSRYRRDALQVIKKVIKKGKAPLFVGGTGLYMSVLVDGIFKSKPLNTKIRDRLYQEAKESGNVFLYQRLLSVDPEAARKIHPNDLRRIVRALEVYEATGKPISQLQKERKGLRDEYGVSIFCLNLARDKLCARVDSRTDKMFKAGFVAEAKRLLKRKLSKTASYAIGLRELKGYFDKQYGLDEARELIKRNTRQYAKRQMTWFRKDKGIEWVEIGVAEKPKEIAERIRSLL